MMMGSGSTSAAAAAAAESRTRSSNLSSVSASGSASTSNIRSGAGSSSSKAEYFIEQLNATNAKKVALLIVIGFIIFHGLIHLKYGTDSCKWLLSDGRFKGDREWQPYGCMMHKYTLTDTRRCIQYLAFWDNHNHFIFIGDVRQRLLYEAFIKHLQPSENGDDESDDDDDDGKNSKNDNVDTDAADELLKNKNLEFVDYKLRLRVNYLYANEIGPDLLNAFTQWQKDDYTPSTIILSVTYNDFIKMGNLTEELLKQYELNVTKLVRPIEELIEKKSKILWKLQDPIDEDKLRIKNENENDNENWEMKWKNVKNKDIDKLNQVIHDVFEFTNIRIWSSSKLIANGLLADMDQGWKLSKLALQHDIQILLNMYCNDYMNYNDGSCCSSAESYTILQIITYGIFAVFVILAIGMIIRKWILTIRGHTFYMPLNQDGINGSSSSHIRSDNQNTTMYDDDHENGVGAAATTTGNSTTTHRNNNRNGSSSTISNTLTDLSGPIYAISSLAIIMAYFYVCDRTNFFMKENKYYSEFSFWIPLGYVFVLGVFFTDESRFTKILHRDQTDELKGWMQLVILIYHMTGADRILPIYMHVKVLISAYLFLSGYGHFTYMWHTGNAGIVRFLQIMFRLNFMTIILCLCMNRPYQFYYFVPLISFWYACIYFVITVPPHITSKMNTITSEHQLQPNPYQYLYLCLKFVGLLSCITVFYMSEVFFERIFVTRPWKALFVTTDDDIHEWWYRWKLDRYTITYGMIFAACFHIVQKYNLIDDNHHGNLFPKRIAVLATALAIGGISFYTIFSFCCRNRQDCEEIHSYIVFIPLIGYIVLRNLSGILRTRFSSFFAWFGRISLELFICQYHIWLAADRHGVLVLLPGFPNLNVLISLFIFICASHEVHRLTQILLPYAVPNDWRLAVRNFIIFLVILIPIGRYDGMF